MPGRFGETQVPDPSDQHRDRRNMVELIQSYTQLRQNEAVKPKTNVIRLVPNSPEFQSHLCLSSSQAGNCQNQRVVSVLRPWEGSVDCALQPEPWDNYRHGEPFLPPTAVSKEGTCPWHWPSESPPAGLASSSQSSRELSGYLLQPNVLLAFWNSLKRMTVKLTEK